MALPAVSIACALEPMINGGFRVSHPESLNVAVAVAKARRDGELSQAASEPVPNDVLLRRMLRDLRRLQMQLKAGQAAIDGRSVSFSLVLAGPGLWSQFHMSRSATLARLHADGPLPDKVTVVSHHAVLQALLNGKLTVEEAVSRGLIVYADGDPGTVNRILEMGLSGQRASPTATIGST
jgi:hypothetical protein